MAKHSAISSLRSKSRKRQEETSNSVSPTPKLNERSFHSSEFPSEGTLKLRRHYHTVNEKVGWGGGGQWGWGWGEGGRSDVYLPCTYALSMANLQHQSCEPDKVGRYIFWGKSMCQLTHRSTFSAPFALRCHL